MSLRLLIVDDNAPFLEAATRVLEADGLQVVGVASTIDEALVRAQELRPDVVLVDVNLGAEDGAELAGLLTDPAGTGPHRVILISTYPVQDLADLVETLPGVGLLSKAQLSGTAVRELVEPYDRLGGGTP
jgi:DNA-binding NarL/FixJ family response regulator